MDVTNGYYASRKRLILSWYIDFLFFISLWMLLDYFFEVEVLAPVWLPYTLFVAIRLITQKYIGSIGLISLSINKDTMQVNETVYDNENWITIFLGVLLILEGTKKLVRWTEIYVSQPVFGFFPDDNTQIIIYVVYGMLSILAGYWFLKLNIKGLFLGLSIVLVNMTSDALSWRLWDPVVEEMVLKRRETYGIPVREGEVEFMQSIFPEWILIFASIALFAMLFTFKRFKKFKELSP
jgi:hypothetical protein